MLARGRASLTFDRRQLRRARPARNQRGVGEQRAPTIDAHELRTIAGSFVAIHGARGDHAEDLAALAAHGRAARIPGANRSGKPEPALRHLLDAAPGAVFAMHAVSRKRAAPKTNRLD